ncbi:hypothetical protein [Paenibacillus harenae]|uniref:Uncharacterized protein n=1 Tax=Paenibacillus harenae TaxID=306543 RepID=A0ABT9U7F3_PAEHA|nr:hypothetical protein [Paenibacillus harenae]MDQ0114374.1 hypothetical protein [Paenibacillus harenae]
MLTVKCQCGSCDKVDDYGHDYYNERCRYCKSRSLWRVLTAEEKKRIE